jgi:excinuclease UvrABC nuclease subunit
LKFFGSVEKMRQASTADLAKAPGMPIYRVAPSRVIIGFIVNH